VLRVCWVGIVSLLRSYTGSNVVCEKVSNIPYLNGMVRTEMDRLFAGRGKQDRSPHHDRYNKPGAVCIRPNDTKDNQHDDDDSVSGVGSGVSSGIGSGVG
jgi:hypothetical protein